MFLESSPVDQESSPWFEYSAIKTNFASGRDLYVLDLRSKIEKEAWSDVLNLFIKQSVAQVF